MDAKSLKNETLTIKEICSCLCHPGWMDKREIRSLYGKVKREMILRKYKF